MADDSDRLLVCRLQDELHVRAVGRMTALHSPALRLWVEAEVAGGAKKLFVYLSDCEYLDSTFIGTLLRLNKPAAAGEGHFLALVGPSPACREILEHMHITRVIEVVAERSPPVVESWRMLECEHHRVERSCFSKNVVEAHEALGKIDSPLSERFRAVACAVQRELDAEEAKRKAVSASNAE